MSDAAPDQPPQQGDPGSALALALQDPGRRRIRAAMTRHSPPALNPDVADLYQDVFSQLLVESMHVPGWGLAEELVLERLAFTWASMKHYDNLGDPIPLAQYTGLVREFTRLQRTLVSSRAVADVGEQFKRAFAQTLMRAVVAALSELLDPDSAAAAQDRVVEHLRAALEDAERR